MSGKRSCRRELVFEPTSTRSPEPFDVFAAESADNRPEVVFAAVDKGQGIDHYEVAERRAWWPAGLQWKVATSPYALGDRYGTSDVYVKAVDRAGNETLGVYAHAHALRPYEFLLLGILLVYAALIYSRGGFASIRSGAGFGRDA